MKKIVLYIFFTVFLSHFVLGQSGIHFIVRGAHSGCYISSVATDRQHNIIVSGYFHKEKSADDTTAILEIADKTYKLPAINGSFLVKLNAKKEVIWLKTNERKINTIYTGIHALIDERDNIFVIGKTQLDLPDGGAIGETFISKYSGEGILSWEKLLDGVTDNGEFKPEKDYEGNIYLTGRYAGNLELDGKSVLKSKSDASEPYILKLNTDGEILLSRALPAEINLTSLSVSTKNEVYATGDFSNEIQIETGFPIVSRGLKDIFYAKYSSSGQLEWVKTIGGALDDECRHITVDSAGNIFMAGLVSNQGLFNTTPIDVAGEGRNIFLAKIKKTTGESDWVRHMTYGGKSIYSEKHEVMTSLEISSDGEPYIFGVVSDFLTINNTTQLLPFFFPFYYLIKYNSNGDFSYAKQYNVSDGYGLTFWNAMLIDTDYKMQIVGTSQSYGRNDKTNDSSFLLDKSEVDACNSQSFSIEKSGDVLKPLEPYNGLYKNHEVIFSDNDFIYQWYKNGEKIRNATSKTLQTADEGYYTLKLISKSSPSCSKSSDNYVVNYSPASGALLVLSADNTNTKLSTTVTMPGSSLVWYRNNQILADQHSNSIDILLDGVYKVKELYGNVVKESNEIAVYEKVVVAILKETFNQLGDPCRPGPLLRSNFRPDVPVQYQWYFNGNAVKDSTLNHFNPSTVGEYQVRAYLPAENKTYVSGIYRLVSEDFPKSLPIVKIEDPCSGKALLKVNDFFMQKYQFQSIVWRLDGQDIPEATSPYYTATKSGDYTFSVKYLIDSQQPVCNYNSFVAFTKKTDTELNVGYSYAGSGCVVDSFKIFVGPNKNHTYSWSKNDTLLKSQNSNELIIKDKGIYKSYINKGDGCVIETEEISLQGCTPAGSNQFLILNPPEITADKTMVLINEKSFVRTNSCSNVNFQWLKDSEPIVGANKAEFEIKQSGSYRLQIEKSGCTAVSEPVKIVVENILSVEEGPLKIEVFPNPSSTILYFRLPVHLNESVHVKLINTAGKMIKEVYKTSDYSLDLRDIPEGIYLLSLEFNNKFWAKKIVKTSGGSENGIR